MDFISILSIFVMACFVGHYVVWSVTPVLHTLLIARWAKLGYALLGRADA